MLLDETLSVQDEQDEADAYTSEETSLSPQDSGAERDDQDMFTVSLSSLAGPDLNTPIVLGPYLNGDYVFSAVLPPRMYGRAVETHSLALEECYIIDPARLGRNLLTKARALLEKNLPVTLEEIDSLAHKLCKVMKFSWCVPQLVRRPIHGHLLVAYAMDRLTGELIGCFVGHMEPHIKFGTRDLEFSPVARGIVPNQEHYDLVFTTILDLVRLLSEIIVE